MTERVSTNLLVASRGHVLDDGPLRLGTSSIQRTNTAISYYADHIQDFTTAYKDDRGGIICTSGGYATMATDRKIAPPPYPLREAPLMTQLAIAGGIPQKHLRTIASPTTTLEVVLRPYEEGVFAGLPINADNPLGIVTQATQYERLAWFTRRIYKLPEDAIQLIEAPGEEDPQIATDEQRIMRMTRAMYGMARTPQGLRRAERIADGIASLLFASGITTPPGSKYLQT